MKFFPYLGLLAVVFLFSACGDDEDDTMAFTDTVMVGATETAITNAYVSNDFFGFDSTLYTLIFTGAGVTEDDGDFSGPADAFLSFALVRAAEGGLPNGTYTISNTDMPGIFGYAYGTIEEGIDLTDGAPNAAATGTLTVGTAGSDRTFVLAVTTTGGETVTMSYSGPLVNLDN